ARVLEEQLSRQELRLRRYQCSSYHVNSSLYPFIEQFERAAGFARDDTLDQKANKMEAALIGRAQQLADTTALFAALLSLPTERYPALNLSPEKQRERTLEALVAQVETLASRQPLVMLFEDAHWIDATSQEALDLLVPRLRDMPVLLIVTYRP